jgi:hypothetical protein
MSRKTAYIAHAVTSGSANAELVGMLESLLENKGYKIIKPNPKPLPGKWALEAIEALDMSDIIVADVSSQPWCRI